uniref:Uncharacterized protein n=1 Tax=Coccolithus braarudii TaxID=221442 RepID=A0A7S0L758_9EUKA
MSIGPKQNTRVAKLPPTCRPPERLVFDLHISRVSTARYDVLPNGDIMWAGGAFRSGGSLGHWVAYDGITFMVRGEQQLRVPLNPPWVDYGMAGYQGARYHVNRDKLCVVSGLIRTSDWRASAMTNPIFTLDPTCRPDKRLVFQVNHHEYSFRVDVLENGEGHLIAGKKQHAWISLSGIVFYHRQKEALKLENGWGRYNKIYRAPSLKKKGNLCVLSGLARAYDGWVEHIATLPEKCRPAQRLIFSVSAHDKSQRIDVLPSGKVMWVDGAKTWVSFDGIRYGVP